VTPRVPPLPREKWDDDVEVALRAGVPPSVGDAFMSTDPGSTPVPNAIASMLHNPAVAGPFLAFNAVLLRKPVLEPRQRELMVLRVAWRTRSEYEWVQHARLASRYDITPEEIATIAGDWSVGDWTPLEADLLAATDQLIDTTHIDDATWARLAAAFDEAALVELLFVVGAYTCLAMVFNGLGVELDPELDASIAPPLPAATE
jgi:4-carboxymuconolactone decarboxylase